MYGNSQQMTLTQARQEVSSIFLAKVFNWMALGLGITGIVAYFTATTGLAISFMSPPVFMTLFIAELGMVYFISARINKIQASTATGLFLGYSILNGLVLSVILLTYTSTSIAETFFVTAGMFGAMAIYGLVTKRDLSGWGSFLIMGFVGIFIAFIVNMFLQSTELQWIASFLGVFIFTGLTAYDVQRIKNMGEQGIMSSGPEAIRKGAIMGALALYLDFINLFLMLLTFLGGGRSR
jgi:hypothetical protein